MMPRVKWDDVNWRVRCLSKSSGSVEITLDRWSDGDTKTQVTMSLARFMRLTAEGKIVHQ